MNGLGDPASLAATASVLRRAAAEIADLTGELGTPSDGLGGRPPAAVRAGVREVVSASRQVTGVAGDLAALLDHTAYAQARRAHERNRLAEQASRAGLHGSADGYVRPPGILGVADARDEAARSAAIGDLRRRLALLEQAEDQDQRDLTARLQAITARATAVADRLR